MYICKVQHVLDNPVFNSILSNESPKSYGSDWVKYYDSEVSPYVGFHESYKNGFADLHSMLPVGRNILYADRNEIETSNGWKLIKHIAGTQFIYNSVNKFDFDFSNIIPLEKKHVAQMVSLATLTKPGPFDNKTIEFGGYHGLFDKEKLISMTGRRLQIHEFIEVSAVCTHPDYGGKGLAGLLMKHQINSILEENKVPFLHVKSDNRTAVELYERLGFTQNGPMNFYFMKRL